MQKHHARLGGTGGKALARAGVYPRRRAGRHSVNVLVGCDLGAGRLLVKPLRQRQQEQYPVNAGINVQPSYRRHKLRLGRRLRQRHFSYGDAESFAALRCRLFVVHGIRVTADTDERYRRRHARVAEALHTLFRFRIRCGGDGCATHKHCLMPFAG